MMPYKDNRLRAVKALNCDGTLPVNLFRDSHNSVKAVRALKVDGMVPSKTLSSKSNPINGLVVNCPN
jgi:hypothetical protein